MPFSNPISNILWTGDLISHCSAPDLYSRPLLLNVSVFSPLWSLLIHVHSEFVFFTSFALNIAISSISELNRLESDECTTFPVIPKQSSHRGICLFHRLDRHQSVPHRFVVIVWKPISQRPVRVATTSLSRSVFRESDRHFSRRLGWNMAEFHVLCRELVWSTTKSRDRIDSDHPIFIRIHWPRIHRVLCQRATNENVRGNIGGIVCTLRSIMDCH